MVDVAVACVGWTGFPLLGVRVGFSSEVLPNWVSLELMLV